MNTTAEQVITALRALEAELRQAGIRRLSLFGSPARGDAAEESDVDLAAEFQLREALGKKPPESVRAEVSEALSEGLRRAEARRNLG